MLNPGYKFDDFSFLHDFQLPIFYSELYASRGQGSQKDNLLYVLQNVNKTAYARENMGELAQLADIYIAPPIDLRKGHAGGVDSASVQKIKLGTGVNNGLRVEGPAELQSGQGNAADRAVFDRIGNLIDEPFLHGYLRNQGGNAKSQVDDISPA